MSCPRVPRIRMPKSPSRARAASTSTLPAVGHSHPVAPDAGAEAGEEGAGETCGDEARVPAPPEEAAGSRGVPPPPETRVAGAAATEPEAAWPGGGVSLIRCPTRIRLPSPNPFQAASSLTWWRNRQAMEKSVSPASTVYQSMAPSATAPAGLCRADSDGVAASGIASAGAWPAGVGSSGIQFQQPDRSNAPAVIRKKPPALRFRDTMLIDTTITQLRRQQDRSAPNRPGPNSERPGAPLGPARRPANRPGRSAIRGRGTKP